MSTHDQRDLAMQQQHEQSLEGPRGPVTPQLATEDIIMMAVDEESDLLSGESADYRMTALGHGGGRHALRQSESEERFRRLLADMHNSSQSIHMLANDIEKSIRRKERRAMGDVYSSSADDDDGTVSERDDLGTESDATPLVNPTAAPRPDVVALAAGRHDELRRSQMTTTVPQHTQLLKDIKLPCPPSTPTTKRIGLQRSSSDTSAGADAIARRKRRYTTTKNLLENADVQSMDETLPAPKASFRPSASEVAARMHASPSQRRPTSPKAAKSSKKQSSKKKDKTKTKAKKRKKKSKTTKQRDKPDIGQPREEPISEQTRPQQQQQLRPSDHPPRATISPSGPSSLRFGADYVMTVQDDTVQTSPSVASEFASNYMVSPKSATDDTDRKQKTLSSMIASSAVTPNVTSAMLSKKSLSSSGSGFNSESEPGTPLEGMGRGRLGQSVKMYHSDDAAVSPLPSVGASRGSISSETGKKKRRSVMFAKETFLIEDVDTSNKFSVDDEQSISMADAAAASPSSFNGAAYFKNKLDVEESVMSKLESGLRSFSSMGDLATSPASMGSKPSLSKSFADEFVVEPDTEEDEDEELDTKQPAVSAPGKATLDTSNQGSQELTDAFVVVDSDDDGPEMVDVAASPRRPRYGGKREQSSLSGKEDDLQGSSQSLQFGNILLVDPADPADGEPVSSERNGRYSDESGISIEPEVDSIATPSTISDITAGRRQVVHETSSGDNTRHTTNTASTSERSPMVDATESIQEQTQPLILRNQISSLTVASDEGVSVVEDDEAIDGTQHSYHLSEKSELELPLGLSPPMQRGVVLDASDSTDSARRLESARRAAAINYRDYVLPLGGSVTGSAGTGSGDASIQELSSTSDPTRRPSLRAIPMPIARDVEALGTLHEHSPPSVENLRNGYTSDESIRQLSVASRDVSIVSLVDDARLAQTPIITGSDVSLVYETSAVWDALATATAGSVVATSVSTEGGTSLVSSGGSSRGGAWRDRAQRQQVVSAAAAAASQVQSLVHEISSRSGVSTGSSQWGRRFSGDQISSFSEVPMPAQALYPSTYDVEAAVSDEVMDEKTEERATPEQDEIPMEELFKLYKKQALEMEYAKRESSIKAVPYDVYSETAAAAYRGQEAMMKARQQSFPNAQIVSVVEEPLPLDMPDTYADDGSPISSEDRWETPNKRRRSKRKKAPPRPRLNYWLKTSLIIVAVALLVGLVGYFSVRFGTRNDKSSSEDPPAEHSDPPTNNNNLNRDDLKHLIIAEDPETETLLNTPGSYSYRALDWLVSDFNLAYSSDPTRLLRRFALAAFYYAMSGESWQIQDQWLEADDECTWFTTASGACRGDSFVLLSLTSNRLTGTRIPRELALISELAWIDLSGNTIFDPIPTYLSNFTSLQNLFLAANSVSGTIPTEIGLLTKLQFLSLSKNFFYGSIPTEVARLTELNWIDLSFNRLDGTVPEVLKRLEKLESLRLESNMLSGSLPVSLHPTVTKMNLAGNNFNGTIPDWDPEFQFKELLLNNNADITGTIPVSLNEATNFDSPQVDLRGTSLSGSIPNAVCEKFAGIGGSILYPCKRVTCAGQCCTSCDFDVTNRDIFFGGG